jgi:hypothetical protein
MSSRSYCNPFRPAMHCKNLLFSFVVLICLTNAPQAMASGDAPQWMHALVNVPLPEHDDKTDAVLLYSETNVTVLSVDKIRTQVREAYKILRPGGREYGVAAVNYRSPGEKVTSLHGWSIPAQGKDYEVKDKEAYDVSVPGVQGSELIQDLRTRLLRIPAADPGNIVGYEYVVEEQPLVLQDSWNFQEESPVRESHYSLQLPAGWEYQASWINYAEAKPTLSDTQLQWVLNNVKGVRKEDEMPPIYGVVGRMIVSFYPPGGPAGRGFSNWKEMGTWYSGLESGRLEPSPEIKQKASALTSSLPSTLEKMQAIAKFVQHDIRYVAIELGIGGWQPHPAKDVFVNRYGDCKDKAGLMRSMLHEIGVESYHVAINTSRGSIVPETPAHRGFNHAIIAVKVPEGVTSPSLVAIAQHPTLGKILFFDPTDDLTPFGQISGGLQANWGMLVTRDGGELVLLPKQPTEMNGIRRNAKLILNPDGTLKGEVKEVRMGDQAAAQRDRLQDVTRDSDQIKPVESLLASSISSFRITQATAINLHQTDLPFGFNYSFEAANYATNAGNLLLVRPRVLGTKSSALLETKEPRKFAIEFRGPERDTDTFEIALPAGYEVDDLPPPVDVDYGYASYHAKSEVTGNVIKYNRVFEVRELSVPASKAEELKKFYRIIATDERNTVVLKPLSK